MSNLFNNLKKYVTDPKFRQLASYNKKATSFWEKWRPTLELELDELLKRSPLDLLEVTKMYAGVTNFPELELTPADVESLQKLMGKYGRTQLIRDLVSSGASTKLLSMVAIPAFAAADGMGIDPKKSEECIYTVGVLLPVSADIADSVLDHDLKPHPKITQVDWEAAHRLSAAGLYSIGQTYLKSMDERIKQRTDKGVQNVSRAEKLDIMAKASTDVSISTLEEIYNGKIGEIEATVFGCINILGGDKHPEFEPGSLYMANEAQVADDFEDMTNEPVSVPIPSFFLTYAREAGREPQPTEDGLNQIIRKAAIESRTKGQIYHQKVVGEFEKLDPSFTTKPVFDSILEYMNEYFVGSYDAFMEGKTFTSISKKLAKLMPVPYKI